MPRVTEEELNEYALPLPQRLVIVVWSSVLALIARLTDAALLLMKPRFIRPYVHLWLMEHLHSPYVARRSFEVIRVLTATGQRLRELVYGELPMLSGVWLFKRVGLGRGSRLVDLGAGRGRALLAARWCGAEASGVELLTSHVTYMAKALARVGIQLVEGDATLADVGQATHVFTNWAAMAPETRVRLVERLRTCAPGTLILTVLHPIEAEDFVRRPMRRVLFTWGLERVWIHEYRPRSLSPG